MRIVVVVFLFAAACAQTAAYTLHGTTAARATLTALDWDKETVLATATSARDGSFAIGIPGGREVPGAPVWLLARARGRATEVVHVGLADEPVDLRLRPGKTVTGRVRDPSGAPIPGARVFYSGRPFHPPGPILERTETDADGRFRLDGIGTAFSYVGADHPAYEWNDVDARHASDVEIVLKPLREVRGRVLADGKPVAGARLYRKYGHQAGCEDDAFFVTGADGRYRAWCGWDNVDDRMESFRVLAAGYRVESCLYDGEDIALQRCAPFVGRVRTSSGEPVAGATVTLDGLGIEQTRETGADGRFRFDAVPLRSSLYDTTLAVEKPGFVRFRQELRLADPPAPMDVRLPRGARFTGRVVRDGKPVPGAGVSAVGHRDLYCWPMLTGRLVERHAFAGRDGRFVMEAVPTDADGVFAWFEESEEPWREFRTGARSVAPVEGRAYDLGDLELRDRLPLRGRVLDHRGRPVKGLKLLCRPLFGLEDKCREQTTETNPDGGFEFSDLPVGHWNVLAGPADDWLIADVVCPGDVLEFRLDPPE